MNAICRLFAALVATAVLPVALSAQEATTVTGRVTNQDGHPQTAVVVRVEALGLSTLTNAAGAYRLVIPEGRVRTGEVITVVASRVGLATLSRDVTVNPGAAVNVDFEIREVAIALDGVVVTGTIGAVDARKVPFAVGTIDGSDRIAPATSMASMLQARVAGATVVSGSGRPGSAPSVLLRGPKSINAQGRSQEPLYIVDGVILGAPLADLDALDVDRIEILKGAAAASLYGSRAANGVVNITTLRGTRSADHSVRYSLRSEFGRSAMAATPDALLTRTHPFALTGDGQFLDRQGNPCSFRQCGSLQLAGQRAPSPAAANTFNTFQGLQWPGQTYDHVARLFTDGQFQQNHLSASGRAGATNFHVSGSHLANQGVLLGQVGQERTNVRVNIDQAIRSHFSVGASAFYSRGSQEPFTEANGNPIFDLTRMPAGIDLFACADAPDRDCRDDPDNLIILPNPHNTESDNPVYALLVRKRDRRHSRFLGSGTIRYSPVRWFDLDGSASLDRYDHRETDYRPLGYRTGTPSAVFNSGTLLVENQTVQAINASVTGSFRFELSDRILNRTQFRYLIEDTELTVFQGSGWGFRTAEVPRLANVPKDNLTIVDPKFPERADGYFAITNFDIADRYVLDLLIRNDGSSLFGSEHQRSWYYRTAGRWLLSEEPWFRLPGVDDLGVRYSVGTAGNRPNWAAQFETFLLTGGSVTFGDLGNVDLRPERTLEHEAGVDLVFLNNRASLLVTHARSLTTDQLLLEPLPAYVGYGNRWINAGSLASTTWEASLNLRLMDTPAFSWDARVNFDRTRSTIRDMDVPEFTYGVPGQNLGNVFFARPGERYGTLYGLQFATGCEHLPAGVDCAQFRTNDDGLLVWTGGDGIGAGRWGELAAMEIQTAHPSLGGLRWGHPFGGFCTDRDTGEATQYCPLGQTLPEYTVNLSSSMSWRGVTVSALVDAVQGFSVYNQPLQWAVFRNTAAIMDQTGKAEEFQKPLSYYDALYGASGLRPSSEFVEDGSFVKLREMALSYHLPASMVARLPVTGVEGIGLFVSGRNLHTWTSYRGFDPEVGKATGQTGSAALGRVDGYQYPNFRTLTLGLELNF